MDRRGGPARARGLRIAVAAEKLREIEEKLEAAPLVREHQFRHHAVAILSGKLRPQPALITLLKREVGLGGIDDLGARVDIGLGGPQRILGGSPGVAPSVVDAIVALPSSRPRRTMGGMLT